MKHKSPAEVIDFTPEYTARHRHTGCLIILPFYSKKNLKINDNHRNGREHFAASNPSYPAVTLTTTALYNYRRDVYWANFQINDRT